MLNPPQIEPSLKPAGDLFLPETYDLTFGGFSPEAFALLDRLRKHPHIGQYRKEKEGIERYVKQPFKRYRDDLVLNWVLPNRLDFETEKNVFSRLLKNDFGAGGCHHHLWMAFYRPARTRLRDVQLSHSISPVGFTVGLYVGDYAADLLRQARRRIAREPERFRGVLNPLLAEGWQLSCYYGSGRREVEEVHAEPMAGLPEGLGRASGIWVRKVFAREDVLRWKAALVRQALEAVRDVWPVYRFIAAGGGP